MNNTLCFVGSPGLFSLTALQTLLAQQIRISQIILAGYAPAILSSRRLPVAPAALPANKLTIETLATQHDIPIHYAGNDINNFSTWKQFPHDDRPDYLFVACFPFRLPAALRQWPGKQTVNLHPSLLPTYRGPNPIFWQLRHGETQTGFSLHLLDETLDTGAILLRKAVHFPQGASADELDRLLAQQGAEAFCHLLSTSIPKPTEQDALTASYHSLPQIADHTLDTQWTAEHAYNFICGTRTPADGYPILIDGQQHLIASAVKIEPQHTLGKACVWQNNDILIQFSPGVLRAKPV